MRDGESLTTYSRLLNVSYDSDDVRYIPNMQQNYKYLRSEKSSGQLVDIICGSGNKLVFVWKKTDVMDELYSLWCKREL